MCHLGGQVNEPDRLCERAPPWRRGGVTVNDGEGVSSIPSVKDRRFLWNREEMPDSSRSASGEVDADRTGTQDIGRLDVLMRKRLGREPQGRSNSARCQH